MRRVVLVAAAAHALQCNAPVRRVSIVVASKQSVSNYIGNQHGGKYNFDGSYVEGASAGADYGRRRKATVPPDEAWAEPTLELARVAPSIDAIVKACDAIVEDAAADVLEVTNDEMGWEAVVCEIVGPGLRRGAWPAPGAPACRSNRAQRRRYRYRALPTRTTGRRQSSCLRIGRSVGLGFGR